jgi:hypothetical protein
MNRTAPLAESQASIKAFLFKHLVPLARGEHDRVGLRSRRSYSEYHFHWLPIATSEIAEVARHFPIALADTQTPMLAAVVGLHRRQSLFIDRHGNWTGGYLPLYLRQMPFHIVRVRSGKGPAQPAVCVDMDSPLVDENEPAKIIEADRIGTSSQDALDAAKEFEQGAMASAAFAQALERSGLAVPLAALPEAADCLSLRSLKAVSPSRLRDASPQMLAPFVSAGVEPLLNACAQSIANFAALRLFQEQRYAEQEAHLRADL